jgi:hypothetical protein
MLLNFVTFSFLQSNMTTPMPCSIDYTPPYGNCTMTQIADIVHGITLKMTFFSVIFYWTNWVFIAFFLIGFLVALCRYVQSKRLLSTEAILLMLFFLIWLCLFDNTNSRKSSNIETYSDDEEEPEGINWFLRWEMWRGGIQPLHRSQYSLILHSLSCLKYFNFLLIL